MRKAVIFTVIFMMTIGCRLFNAGNPNDPVVVVSDDDVAMNAAIQEAQQTLYFFLENFQSPKPDQTYFGIKARFS